MIHLKYLAYNFLRTDLNKLAGYARILSREKGIPIMAVYFDILRHLLKFNTLFLDYFNYRYFEESNDPTKYTNVWDMYLFHKKYNGVNAKFLRNKLLFKNRFKKYSNYDFFDFTDRSKLDLLYDWIKQNKKTKLVAKQPTGAAAGGILVLEISYINGIPLIENKDCLEKLKELRRQGFTLFECYISQHEVMKDLHPKSINTIRVVTFLNKKKQIDIWGALLRIGVNKNVDNFHAGGISAPIDIKTGEVISTAINKDPFDKREFKSHPVTKCKIIGLQIPFWTETVELINTACLEINDVRTVGWDVAITSNGPILIEGNDNWDKTHLELVSRTGLNSKIRDGLKFNR